ncbi:MAG: GTPase ObgE [Candidatus Paceibacterota bacterium]
MIDLVSLTIKAGNGGNGRISFRREKYVPKGGPDGGKGGDGGSVILIGSRHHNTLQHFSGIREISAPVGGKGESRKKTGAKGEDIIWEVPLGTVVWLVEENETSTRRREKYSLEHNLTRAEVEIAKHSVEKEGAQPPLLEEEELKSLPEKIKLVEILNEGQKIVLCQGGFGGRGNVAFKGSTNTTPLEAEYGSFGEQKRVTLELKLLADVGLVGYPNAGKSTLLSKITRANPKTADYPFTTIEPNLGVLTLPGGKDLVVADIPGLIEGASSGKGLGYDFLRHIENTRVLLFVLFLEESIVSDVDLTDSAKADQVWQQYQHLCTELTEYQVKMLQKPSLIALNKIDIYSPELVKAIALRFKKAKQTIHPFSGFTGEGLAKLIEKLARLAEIKAEKKTEIEVENKAEIEDQTATEA